MRDPRAPLIVTLPHELAKKLIYEMEHAKPVDIAQKTKEAEEEFIADLKRAGTYELFVRENSVIPDVFKDLND